MSTENINNRPYISRRLKKFNHILDYYKDDLSGWRIKIIHSGGALCVHSKKEIWIDEKNFNKAFFLHELAHAFLPKENKHDYKWAYLYTWLVNRWENL